MDLAELGLSVRSDGVVVAENRLDGMTRASNRADKATAKLIKRTQQMGRIATRYLTLPLIAAGAASIKMASDFDSSLTKIITLVGLTREEVAGFRKDILLLAPAVGKTPLELANGLFAVTSAGQRGAKAMNTLTLAAKASAIGMGDTRVIALASAAAVQAYGEANLSTADSIDILVGTIEQGNLEASSLAPVLGRIIGIAAELGVAFEDVGAFIATFSRLGVDAAESTTALRGVLSGLLKATPETEKAFEKMGTSVKAFREEIADEGFVTAFQRLVRKAQSLGVDISELIPEVRALSGVLGVFGGEGNTAAEVLDGVSASVGTLEKRFKDVQELDPAFQMAQLKAELAALSIEIGTDLMPVWLDFVRTLRDGIKWFRELSPAGKTVAKVLAGIAVVVGPLLIIFSKLVLAIKILRPLVLSLAGSFTALFGPVGWIVAGITALGLLGLAMKGTKEETVSLSDEVDTLIDSMQKMGQTSADLVLEKLNTQVGNTVDTIINLKNHIEVLTAAQQLSNEQWRTDRIQLLNEQLIIAQQKGAGLTDQLTRLTNAQAEQAARAKAASDALEANAKAATAAAMAIRLTKEELASLSTWWETLRAEMDPAAEALRQYEAAVKMLDLAIANGIVPAIDRAEAIAHLQEVMREATSDTELADWWADLSAEIDPVAAATAHYEKQIIKLDKAIKAGTVHQKDRGKAVAQLEKNMQTAIDATEDWRDTWDDLKAAIDPAEAAMQRFTLALDAMNKVREAMEGDGTFLGDAYWNDMADGLARAVLGTQTLGDELMNAAQASGVVLSAIQNGVEQGSKEYELLEVAIQAANVVSAIGAVLNQAKGDPYTAGARMAAMAAMVSALIGATISISGMGGGFVDDSVRRQEEQGTGSVLGDAFAKSESIANAVEITASATEQLVGINRGMLHALQSMQAGIGNATGTIARGGDLDFGALPSGDILGSTGSTLILSAVGALIAGPVGALIGGLLDKLTGGLLGKLLGGSSKVTDEGIAILAGNLQELIDGDLIKAYQQIKFKKWKFGSTKRREQLQDLQGDAAVQIGLVFQALSDAVREGALALGISGSEIQRALDEFQVAEMRISLKDLSAEEQAAEIQAVFSKIFDDLALAVVPWLDQFQKVGEGLGETLVRVATSVQVMQEAVNMLGFSLDETDPEKYAQIAVGLVEMAGGVDQFISKMQNFITKFATDEHKLAVATDAITRGLAAVGLALPDTAEGFWDLMQYGSSASAYGTFGSPW